MTMKIDKFDGTAFKFLSNFYPAVVVYEGIEYPTSEHAYQAAKTLDIVQRNNVAMQKHPADAKRYGKAVSMRPNWDRVKVDVMEEIVYAKFTQNENLGDMLVLTEDMELIEGNTWGDTFWGVCDGVGENNLGKVLMRVRDRLNNIEERDPHYPSNAEWEDFFEQVNEVTNEKSND